MYYPPNFDRQRAIELGELVQQAYLQFQNYKQGLPWTITGGYELLCEVCYHVLLLKAEPTPEANLAQPDFTTIIEAEAISDKTLDKTLLGHDIPMGFVAQKDQNLYLVFRGTQNLREWGYDLNEKLSPYLLPEWGQVHDGFQKIYQRCRDSFLATLGQQKPDLALYITGHSLGAALSVLSLPDVAHGTGFQNPTLYNFGCPRVGDNTFVTAYNTLPGQKTFRVVNTSDLATSVPLPTPVPVIGGGYYSHVDTPVDFTLQANSVETNHAMATYLKALSTLKKQANKAKKAPQ